MKAKLFYLSYCPYCRRAIGYIEELKNENPTYRNADIEMIEENENKSVAKNYDYYYVPCFFVDEEKVFEGAMEKEDVKKVLDMLV
jgi:glutaredoxin